MSELIDKWAVVTGASSGLGTDFAEILAERGANLVLVARRKDRLEALAQRLISERGIEARVVATDLAEAEGREALAAQLAEDGIDVDVLINNAGFGVYGRFVDADWQREDQMLQLNVVALTHLTKLFLRGMVARNRGWVLQVASIGAYQPSPMYGAYSATKAYVLSFGEALSFELRDTNVKVSVLSPGVTKTEFLDVAGQRPNLYQRMSMATSRAVADAGIRAMLRGQPSHVPGLLNQLPIQMLRLTPRRFQARIANLLMSMK